MSTTYVRRSSEDVEQQAVIQWARMSSGRYPELALLHHIPNGGNRNAREGAKLKRMGVLAGAPDLHLPAARGRYHSLYIEMKFDDGRLLKSQREFLTAAAGLQNYCVVCYSAADAIEAIQTYIEENPRYNNLSVIKGGRVVGKIK